MKLPSDCFHIDVKQLTLSSLLHTFLSSACLENHVILSMNDFPVKYLAWAKVQQHLGEIEVCVVLPSESPLNLIS